MTTHQYLSPINRQSTFAFPWSLEHRAIDQTRDDDRVDDGIHGFEFPLPHHVHDENEGTAVNWKVFSRDQDAGDVVMQLLRDSWCLFKQLRLENWVEFVMGIPSATLAVFESYHNRLSFSLFCFLCHFPIEAEKYDTVAKVSSAPQHLLYTSQYNSTNKDGREFTTMISFCIRLSHMLSNVSRWRGTRT